MTTALPQRDFGFGDDETELRDLARRFLADRLPATRLRELVATDHEAVYARGESAGWDADLWTEIVDMGWTATAVPEDAGGTPVSTAGLVGLAEEAGFRALPSPLASTIAATRLLVACDRDAARPHRRGRGGLRPLHGFLWHRRRSGRGDCCGSPA